MCGKVGQAGHEWQGCGGMDDALIGQRVAAYERALAEGCTRYGSRAGDGPTALQVAARELGLKTVAPVRKALEAAGHAHARAHGSAIQKRKALAAAHARTQVKASQRAAVRYAERFPSAFTHASRAATIWRMRQHGSLDRSDYNALDAFRVSFELVHSPAVRAIDTTREYVDSGSAGCGGLVVQEQAMQHQLRLDQAERRLGPQGFALAILVAGKGETLVAAARALGLEKIAGGKAAVYAGQRLREVARTLRELNFGSA